MNEVLVGVGVLPHRTPMTPRDLLAVHLHWKGSRDCRMSRLAHMGMQSIDKPIDLWYVGGNGVKYKISANTTECVREV